MMLDEQRYLCSIPAPPSADAHNVTASSSPLDQASKAKEEQKELARATDRGWQLLQGMDGSCIYFLSGWWSYSFCYNKEVRQFHQLPPSRGVPSYPPVEDPSVQGFVLGRFPAAEKKGNGEGKGRKSLDGREAEKDDEGVYEEPKNEVARLETKGEMRYMVQLLGGGTTCDLTGKERKIEVQVRTYNVLQDWSPNGLIIC